MFEAFFLGMKKENVPYRLLVSHTVIAVEEIIQRSSNKFFLLLDVSGISSLQYQLTNLLAHSTFFLSAYLLFFLFLEATSASLFHLTIDELPFVLTLFLGVLASVSFS